MANANLTDREARRAARRNASLSVADASGGKVCGCCGKAYTRPEFLALALPSNGVGEAMGLVWRNCSCGSTLVG